MFLRETIIRGGNYPKIKKFDDSYRMFENILMNSNDLPVLKGLSELLPITLEKIAVEKIDRSDIITYFPVIWMRFESYLRIILYIINREEYKYIKENKLGFNETSTKLELDFPRNKRTLEYALFKKIHKLRNIEAHDCVHLSNSALYENLAITLLGYLYITEKKMDALKAANSKEEFKFFNDLTPLNIKRLTKPSMFFFSDKAEKINPGYIRCLWDTQLPIKRICQSFKNGTTRIFCYNTDGYLKKLEVHYQEGERETINEWNYINRICNGSIICSLENSTNKLEEVYTYDVEGRLIFINRSSKNLNINLEIEYTTDGKIIFHETYKNKGLYEESDDIITRYTRTYNSNGFLETVYETDEEILLEEYKYSEDGCLEKILRPGYEIDVKYCSGSVVFDRKLSSGKTYKFWKWIIDNSSGISRINKIIIYDDKNNEIRTYQIEYF